MKWKRIDSKEVLKTGIFSFRIDRCETAQGKIMPRYYVLDFPSWVQVIALTPKNEIVIVNQYRYPGEGQFLELPGGTSDPHSGESALQAAQRELLEETGYSGEKWIEVGSHFPNPALQTNRCYVFLATGCQKIQDPELDPFEELSVEVLKFKDFTARLKKSGGAHALILASLYLAEDHLKSIVPANANK